MNALVATVSRRDPFVFGLVGSGEFLGPVLSVLASGDFSSLYLLTPPELGAQGDELLSELAVRFPELSIQSIQRGEDAPPVPATFAVDAADASALADWLILFRSGLAEGRLLAVEPAARPAGSPVLRDCTPSPDARAAALIREPAVAAVYQTAGSGLLTPEMAAFGILGSHPALTKAVEIATTVGPHDVPVLIQGETGTGKELFARYVHACSGRHAGPFVAVNCGAIPENLVESTLFGHRKGAFTGADRNQSGKFLEATGGTLFLDEIAELPLEHQPKLLRALQERVIDPVGGKPTEVDVRVVAASHQNLAGSVRAGAFREDLYYRLAFASVPLPPLRERASDIPELAEHLLRGWNRSLRTPRRLAPEAVERLRMHSWPGNVRELQAVIGRSLMFSQNESLKASDLVFDEAPERLSLPVLKEGFALDEYLQELRTAIILKALHECAHNKSAAARQLGMSPQAVSKFVKQREEDA